MNNMLLLSRKGQSVYRKNFIKEKERKHQLKNIKATVDTGLRTKKASEVKKENIKCEFVLDPKPKPATLAQKLGIFPLNDNQKQLMSENEWHEVKQKSIKRE